MANYNDNVNKCKFAVVVICLGIIQGCYDSKLTNNIKVDEKIQSSIIAEQATVRSTYANCLAAIPTNLKTNTEENYKNQCEQAYKTAWSKTIQDNK